MDVTVVIASHGGEEWHELALKRARPSALAETECVLTVHSPTASLAEVRNTALQHVQTEWVCFLDADDELEPGYLEAMTQGNADVRAPAVRYVPWNCHPRSVPAGRTSKVPKVVGHTHSCTAECLAYGNWVVIGAVVRTELLRAVGGFAEWPVYEDWAAFAALAQHGATFEAVPHAVYRAHARASSRNRGSMTAKQKHAVHQDIARSLGLPVPA